MVGRSNDETDMIEDFTTRHYPFLGCFNFRDIGGYPAQDGRLIRPGQYFRAGRQDRMTQEDLSKLKLLGIRTQIDLRKPSEIKDQGRGPLETLGASYRHIAIIPEGGSDRLSQLVGDTGISGKRYLGYLEFGSETWVEMFDIFANPESQPILLNCTAGKDRTGVATAFLLSVLGVHRVLIEEDYKLTNRDLERQADFIEKTSGFPEGMNRQQMMKAAGVPENALSDFLDGLQDRWGGAIGYLRSIGITEQTLAAVRQVFLE